MNEFFANSTSIGIIVSILSYEFGLWLKRKLRSDLCNPLLIAVLITIGVVLLFKIDYVNYNLSAQYLSYLLTPATVCLALPMYQQLQTLRKYFGAIAAGVLGGVLGSLTSVFILVKLFNLNRDLYLTLLPKSITTAIGVAVAGELGAYVTITVSSIVITGIFGNIIAEPAFRLARITEPVAQGVALGSSSHAIGTAKAVELGELQGAISSLALVLAGIITVIFVNYYALLVV